MNTEVKNSINIGVLTLAERIAKGLVIPRHNSKHQGTKRPYNFKKVKRNKRISDKSKKINRK